MATAGAGAAITLEFDLDPPSLAARVNRHPAIAELRGERRPRSLAEELIWLDTAEGGLAAGGCLMETPRRGPQRLLRTMPVEGLPWLPGTPATVEAGRDAAAAAPALADGAPLVPLAAFSGRRTTIPLDPGPGEAFELSLLTGKLRAVAAERPVARLLLRGPEPAVLALARRLALDLPLLPPAAALAEEGRALARGEAVARARRRAAPDLGAAATVEAALLTAIGHLLQVMLHQAPLCRLEAGPDGVHQMRVALRRLRSVLKVFRPAHRGAPAVARFDAGLGLLAKRLGEARDLDVFMGGIGARIAALLPEDRRMAALIRAVETRRSEAYGALREALEAPGFRHLVLDGLALLLERPWRETDAAEEPAPDRPGPSRMEEKLAEFACRSLDKRWHRLCARGEEIEALGVEALHDLRLEAKRLRYAAELFAPLWRGKSARRFLRRLSALQETLGTSNDAAVARALVAGLGTAAPAWAVGAVEGFALAAVGDARGPALKAWEDLMDTSVFWSPV